MGNILGFSLLFRDRRALLALPRRGLAPGVKLRDYEAEIPGVQFPLKGPLSAVAFRSRRCRAQQATLSIEARGLRRYLKSRLVGRRVGELRITGVALDLRATLPETPGHRPVLRVQARRDDGQDLWLIAGVRVEPLGRRVRLTPSHLWLIGRPSEAFPNAEALWVTLARRIAGHRVELQPDVGAMVVDPAKLTLTPAFVGAGWKTPDLNGLALETLALSRRAVTMELRAGDDAEGVNVQAGTPERDTVALALTRANEKLDAGEFDAAIDILEQTSDLLGDMPDLRLAVVQWRVQLARWRSPEATTRALREWLDLRPSDHRARRMLMVLLAQSDDAAALAKLLAADCRSPHPPVTQARLELALATVLVDKLGESRSALALAGPLVARLRGDERVAWPVELLPNALVCLAQARAAESVREGLAQAPHAIAALDEALALVDSAARRCDMRARLARTFARCRAPAPALRLLMAALQEDPQSVELLDDAIALAEDLGELDVAADLLRVRTRLAPVADGERERQRRRLAEVLIRIDTPAARDEALDLLRAILDFEPDDPQLLRLAADLEQSNGDPLIAAEHLGRYLDDEELDPRQRAETSLERARLLRRAGELDLAWETLGPVLRSPAWEDEADPEPAESPSLETQILELALELAPPTDRDRLLDRLIERSSGPARGRALLERAAQSFEPKARLRDLWAAAEVLEDPSLRAELRPALEALLRDDQIESLERLAKLAEQDDDAAMARRVWLRLGRAHWRAAQAVLDGADDPQASPESPRAHAIEAAITAFGKASRSRELPPADFQSLARALASIGRRADALDAYQDLLDYVDTRDERSPASANADRRELETLSALVFEAIELARDMRRPDIVARLLERYDDSFDGEAKIRAGHLRFDALRQLDDEDETRAFVLSQLDQSVNEPQHRVRWLARAASFSEGRSALEFLREAHELDPQDETLQGRYRQALAEHGSPRERVDDLLIRYADPDPSARLDVLRELLALDAVHQVADPDTRLAWHEARLELDPESVDSLLAAAELHRNAGHHDTATDRFRRAALRLQVDDPRRLAPARALATAAIDVRDFDLARAHLNVALELIASGHEDPEARDGESCADMLLSVARELDDAPTWLRALDLRREAEGELTVAESMERVRALVSVDRIDEAFSELAATAARVQLRSIQHLELAELWLSLSESQSRKRESYFALAQLRLALGPDLSLADLVREIELGRTLDLDVDAEIADWLAVMDREDRSENDDVTGPDASETPTSWEVALRLLCRELVRRDAPAQLVDIVDRFHVDPSPSRTREALQAQFAALAALGDEAGAPRLAARLVELARTQRAAELCLRALERLPDAGRKNPEWADARDWALSALDRVEDAKQEVRSRVARAPVEPIALERWRRLEPGDAGAHELLAIAAKVDDEALAVALIQAALAHCERPGFALYLDALRHLHARGRDEATAELWLNCAALIENSDGAHDDLRVDLLEIGVQLQDESVRLRAVEELTAAIRTRPGHPQLLRVLWLAAQSDPAPSSPRSALGVFARHLDDIIADPTAQDPRSTFDAAMQILEGAVEDRDTIDRWLQARVETHASSPDARALPLEHLARRAAWASLCACLAHDLEGPDAVDAQRWRDLADHAASDDPASELFAIRRAYEAFCRTEDSASAVECAARILQLAPTSAAVRWQLAEQLMHLDRVDEARLHFATLLDDEAWSDAGIELAKLAQHAGMAFVGHDDARAIELIELARSRASGPDGQASAPDEAGANSGDALEETLFALYVSVGRHDEAKELALACMRDAADPSTQATWLRRAHAHARGPQRLELVRLRLQQSPDDLDLVCEAQALAEELGDLRVVHAQLERRVELEPGRAAEHLRRLIEDLELGRPAFDPDALFSARARLLDLEPERVDLLLAHAEAVERRGDLAMRDQLWARAVEAAEPGDERVLSATRALAKVELHARGSGDLERADRLLARALDIDPEDRATRELHVDVARLRGDANQVCDRLHALLRLTRPIESRHDIYLEIAQQARAAGDFARAQLAYARATDELAGPEAAEPHPKLAEHLVRWREWARDATTEDRVHYELEALQATEQRLPQEWTRPLREREVELLLGLGDAEGALARCERELLEQPDDADWADGLRACLAMLAPEEHLRVMRRLVDALPSGHARDHWALELATAAREQGAARTTLVALEALSHGTSDEGQLLELREWAIRELGEVDDELAKLESQLFEDPTRDHVARRIARLLDKDPLGFGERMAALADRGATEVGQPSGSSHLTPDVREGLLRARALSSYVEAGAHGLTHAIGQLARAVPLDIDVDHAWAHCLALAQTAETVKDLKRLVEIAIAAVERHDDGGDPRARTAWKERADASLSLTLARAPDDAELHGHAARWVQRLGLAAPHGEGGQAPRFAAHAQWLKRVADAHDLDDLNTAELFVHAHVEPELRVDFLFDTASSYLERPRVVDAIEDELDQAKAWDARLRLLEARGESTPSRWLELAKRTREDLDTGARTETTMEVNATAYVRAAECFEADDDRVAAAAAYSDAVDVHPQHPELRIAHVEALDRVDEAAAALVAWRNLLVDGLAPDPLAASQRAAELAARVGDLGVERNMLELGLTHAAASGAPGVHADLAERLFFAHEKAESKGSMGALAVAMTQARLSETQQLPWRLRAAEHGPAEQRREHLVAALELIESAASPQAPIGDTELEVAAALERELRANDDVDQLRAFLRRRAILASRRSLPVEAQGRAWRKLRESYSATSELEDDEARADLAMALQGELKAAPADPELRLRLGRLRASEGDDESAAHHYREAIARLAPDDERLYAPSRVLARVAMTHGDAQAAIEHLQRARTLRPDDPETLAALAEVAKTSGRPALLAEISAQRLEHASHEQAAELLRDRIEALLSVGDETTAAETARSGAHRQDLTPAEREGFARIWIRSCVSTEDDPERFEHEARARAYLRQELADGTTTTLTDEDIVAEVRLMMRRGMWDDARELSWQTLAHAPEPSQWLELFESTVDGSLKAPDRADRLVPILRQLQTLLLESQLHPSARRRIASRLVQLAVEAEDAEACLAGLEALPPEQAEEGELLEHREWALRSLGQVPSELQRLELRLESTPDPYTAMRLHRLCGDVDSTRERLWKLLASMDPPSTEAVELARVSVDLLRSLAPARLDLLVEALEHFSRLDALEAFEAQAPALVALSEAQDDVGQLEELLTTLANAADPSAPPALLATLEPIFAHALTLAPSSRTVHGTLREVLPDETAPSAIHVRVAEVAAARLGPHGGEAGRLWVAVFDDPSVEAATRADGWLALAQRYRGSEAAAKLLVALARAGHHAARLEYWRDASLGTGRRIEALTSIADDIESSAAGDTELHAVVLRELAWLHVEAEDPGQVHALERALRASPGDPALSYALGCVFEAQGRNEAALEHLLPFADADRWQVGEAGSVIHISRGPNDPPSASVEVDAYAHLLRCAHLLRASSQLERSADYFARAAEVDDGRAHRKADDAASTDEIHYATLLEAKLTERAEALCSSLAEAADARSEGSTALAWRRRAAALARGDSRVRHLRSAIDAAPHDDELAAQLCDALDELGDLRGLAEILERRIANLEAGGARGQSGDASEATKTTKAARARLAALARRRLALVAADRNEAGIPAPTEAQVHWWRLVLDDDPNDVDAILSVAAAFDSMSDEESERRAIAAWLRAGQLLARDDDRFFEPARALAAHYAMTGEAQLARENFERALEIRPGDRDTLQALGRVADALGDEELRLKVRAGLLAGTQEPATICRLELESAAIHLAAGRGDEAFAAFERAATTPGLDDEAVLGALDAWLSATRSAGTDLDASQRVARELEVRAHLRSHHGDALTLEDLLAECELLARSPGRIREALALLEQGLVRWPTAGPLHAVFRQVAEASDNASAYADALARVAERDDAPKRELHRREAFARVELEDADGVLRCLDQLRDDLADDAELLDLRDWALRRAGRLDVELDELDRALLDAPRDALSLERLLRSLDRDAAAAARRLATLASRADDATARTQLATVALGQLETLPADAPPHADLRIELAHRLLEDGGRDVLRAHWSQLTHPLVERGTPADFARLVELAREVAADGQPLQPGPRWLLARGLANDPADRALHVAFWAAYTDEGEAPAHEEAERAMAAIVEEIQSNGEDLAAMWIAFVHPLERRARGRVLARRARERLADRDAFALMVGALEQDNHWAESVSLWEAHVDSNPDAPSQVDALKHLAHLAAHVLGDPDAAIEYLERARQLTPQDPDLLLPLLDHYYARPALARAIELSREVLEHVPMGDVAFAALGHRAADAALAHGDHAGAVALLDRVLSRCPDDRRTQQRREELGALADDPEHRTRMLLAIADRQSGSARIEALEERARLLVEPLGRLDEAIAVLERVLNEAPTREQSAEKLLELYRQGERWAELVELLERRFAQATGGERRAMLEEIANVQRYKLFDLPKAEQALKLALEDFGDTLRPGEELDRLISGLSQVLDQQGRYTDLIEQLRVYLAPELAGSRPLSASRIELATILANALREHGDDPEQAARLYAQLEGAGHLPETGLATLARWYRAEQRHEDLVRVLQVRAERLAEAEEPKRRAEVLLRIGELLDGPVRRPHEAADYFLDAYLIDPVEFADAGNKARVLLAGTDSVVNVRQRLLARAGDIEATARPALLTLLGDLLAPHEEHESEAETVYRRAIAMNPDLARAHERLGRLMARQARLEDAAEALVAAATSPHMEADRAADNAATAARVLFELDRVVEAEQVLRQALGRAPNAQRALLELARLYDRLGRRDDQADVLDELSALPVSSILRAEIAYRRAMLLEEDFRRDPLGDAGERARGFLLEAVSSDNMHAQARQVLLDLATERSEWSIVAHMYYLAIRELGPGLHKAQTHLDLAEVYLDRLSDHESATRNVASAVAQAPREPVVVRRAGTVAARLPNPSVAASRMQEAALSDQDFDNDGRARLMLLAAELWQRADAYESATEANDRAAALEGLHEDLLQAIRRSREGLSGQDAELRRERAALLRLLDDEDHAAERMHILGRLRELGRALEDPSLVSRADREQLELAQRLLDEEAEADPAAALVHLRELFAEHQDYSRVLAVYDELISRTADDHLAAGLLTDAARLAWAGQRDAKAAYERLRAALAREPGATMALEHLAELLSATEDPEIRSAILAQLSDEGGLARAPNLALRLADTALRESQPERARRLLEPLLQADIDPALQMQVLATLDAALEAQGLEADRISHLQARVELAREHAPAKLGDFALQLANVQRALGALADARDTVTDAILHQPSHVGLTRLCVDLMDLAEDWAGLARALEQLAALTIDPEERARWLTRAARVQLAHGRDREFSRERARGLLLEACETSRRSLDPRAELVPLAFEEGRWDEVLEYAIQLRAIAGDDHECLIQAAIAEAYVHGRRTMARAIDRRHDRSERARSLWPSVTSVLDKVARQGPLPRLDAVLGAAASMSGGTQRLLDEYSAWAAGRNVDAGTHLARARLHEAADNMGLARHLYQLAAFTAPGGPVVDLIRRLPPQALPMDPLREQDWIPLEWRCALREVLIQLRTRLAGVRAPNPIEFSMPETTTERATIQSAGRLTAPWRETLGMAIPVRLTKSELPMSIAVRNEAEPLILLNGEFIHLPEGERAFRLAMACTTIATGLALLDDSYPGVLNDLVDALVALVNPRHVPVSDGARTIVESLAAAGMTGAQLPTPLRERLGSELGHWFAKTQQLEHVIRRSRLLLATRLSGRLDGALMAMARDRGLIVEGDPPDATTVLDTDDARWLLLSLGIFGSGFDPATGHAY